MRFTLDDDQRGLLDAVATLLQRHAGSERMRSLGGGNPAYDVDLDRALTDGGYLDCLLGPDTGPLEAALVTESAAKLLAVAPVGVRSLVVPALLTEIPPGPVTVAGVHHRGPVRYGADAGTVIVIGDSEVRLVHPAAEDRRRAVCNYGYPMGTVDLTGGEPAGSASVETALSFWQVALAAELVGTMTAAFDLTLDYVRQREQFGRPVGSFQALQHRLAEMAILLEGSRWLTREAAWLGMPVEASAAALAQAMTAGRRILFETHQMTGAMGFTTEYDLHLSSMRIPVLLLEAEEVVSPGRRLAASRWSLATS
jgi:hypothetical protein